MRQVAPEVIHWLESMAPKVRRLAPSALAPICLPPLVYWMESAPRRTGNTLRSLPLDTRKLRSTWSDLHPGRPHVHLRGSYGRDGSVPGTGGGRLRQLRCSCGGQGFGALPEETGGQAQFSVPLSAQNKGTSRFAELQTWLIDNLRRPLSVERMASHTAMSPRNFARVFVRETGTTPARFLEQLRVEMPAAGSNSRTNRFRLPPGSRASDPPN